MKVYLIRFAVMIMFFNGTASAQYGSIPIDTAFTTNFFSGSYQSNPSSNFQRSQLKAETRFGLNIGGGVDYNISEYVGAVFGAKYCFANLIGKGAESDVESYQVALNDGSNGNQEARNISYFQFYAGVSFFFQDPF